MWGHVLKFEALLSQNYFCKSSHNLYKWSFGICLLQKKEINVCFHINHPAFKGTAPFCSSLCSELSMGASPSINPNAVFSSCLRSEDISLDPLGPQDRLPEPPFVTDSCIKEKYNLTFHHYLENFRFQSTNHLPEQSKEIMVNSLCWIMHGFQLSSLCSILRTFSAQSWRKSILSRSN